MNFWIRTTILGLVLISLAIALFSNQELLFSSGTKPAERSAPTEQLTEKPAATSTVQATAKEKKKNNNAAADGLSRFYANLVGDDSKDGPKIRNNIVYLPEPKGDLVEILEARKMVTRALRSNWKGSTENRPFRTGETLFQKLSEYANKDGLEVIWWLNRDFLVKDPFRINKDILKTAFQLGKGIEGHFQQGMRIYFCNKQRALVLIDVTEPYLDDECILLPVRKRH